MFFIIPLKANAADGDTIKVRTIELGQTKTGKFLFPAKTIRFQKILMNYKIKCPCAEWDYLAYVYINGLEMFRYITPYGNGLSVGDGFTWIIDVTDFEPLLHDSVSIDAPNTQEPIEITFDFILGIPSRDVVKLEKLWAFSANYNKDFEQKTPPLKIFTSPEDKMTRLKVIQTGHGFGANNPCAEFCPKIASVFVNGTLRYNQTIWREDCSLNPLYPQGGTWLYSRSNWCPGSDVRYYNYELTGFLNKADSNVINYDMEPSTMLYTGFAPRYDFTSYLITYSNPNFLFDAELLDIIAPTYKQLYLRRNPVCNNPIILIRNNGMTPLTSLVIKYGVMGGGTETFNWLGSLNYLETQEVYLPNFEWGDLKDKKNEFWVEISNPNGRQDEYLSNNKGSSMFDIPPLYYNEFVLMLRTNQYANEQYSYTMKNSSGGVIFSRKMEDMLDFTTYQDTFKLADGCYEFTLKNKLLYGLNFFAVRDQLGTGWVRFESQGSIIKDFNPDFGAEIYHQFRVGPKPTIVKTVDTLNFGNIYFDSTKTMTFEIYPANKSGIIISSIKIVLGDKWGFSIQSTNPDMSQGEIKLNYGERMLVTVALKPKKAGRLSAIMNITSNDERQNQINVRLVANGIDPNGVEDNKNIQTPLNLSVSSNPISEKATINFSVGSSFTQNAKLAVYNTNGVQIEILHYGLTDNFSNTLVFNPGNLPNGIYYLVLTTNNSSKSLPVIIMR